MAARKQEKHFGKLFSPSSYGFARSVGTTLQRQRSSSTRLAAVAVPKRYSHSRSQGTLTEHGAAALAGAKKTARVFMPQPFLAELEEEHFEERVKTPAHVP